MRAPDSASSSRAAGEAPRASRPSPTRCRYHWRPILESSGINQNTTSSSDDSDHPWQIGEWRVEPTLLVLQRGDEVVRVPAKPMAVLLRLAREPGACVRRSVLIDEVWERQFVNDEALSRTVAELRRYLGDNAREPAYIQTIPKRGYRLLATVQPLANERAEPATAGDGPRPAPVPGGGVGHAARTRSPRTAMSRLPWLLATLLLFIAAVVFWVVDLPGDPAPGLQQRLLLARPLTVERSLVLTPRWLPGGKQLVYARIAERGSGVSQLILRSLDGLNEHVLVNDGQLDACPMATPDGGQLIWMRHSDSRCEVLQRPLLGGDTVSLGDCWRLPGQFNCADISANGQTLYLTAPSVGGEAGVVAVDRTSRARTVLSSPPAGAGYDLSPRLSPDGTRLAFSRTLPNQLGRLHVLRLHDADETPLQDEAHGNNGHVWLDDDHLLLASDSNEIRALLLVDAASGRSTVLGARGARRPDLADDGGLIWEAVSPVSNLWLRERGGADAGTRITHSRAVDQQPSLDPQGRRVAYVSNRQGREAVWLLDLQSGAEERLPLPADSSWRQPAWSGDGASLWLQRQGGDDGGICHYSLRERALHCPAALRGGSQPVALDDGSLGWLRPSVDGPSLWRYWPASGEASAWLPGSVLRWSAIGDRLLLQRPGEPRVAVHRLDHPDKPLQQIDIALSNAAWSGHAGGVLWIEREGPAQRWLCETGWDGTARRLGPLPVEAAELGVSRDGQRWVVGQIDELEVDLMWAPPAR